MEGRESSRRIRLTRFQPLQQVHEFARRSGEISAFALENENASRRRVLHLYRGRATRSRCSVFNPGLLRDSGYPPLRLGRITSPNLGEQYYRVVEKVSSKNSKHTTKYLVHCADIVYI